ncbi:MAG: EF-hand domain-containing protein [Roseobacter sp.]
MKRLTFAAGIAVCAVALASTVAVAKQRPGHGGEPIQFEKLDENGDGQITRAEMEAMRANRFTRADANGDGDISLEEMQELGAERARAHATRIMERLDRNDDGVLSADEMPSGDRASRRFDRVDADEDGVISKVEFDAAQDRIAKRRPKAD